MDRYIRPASASRRVPQFLAAVAMGNGRSTVRDGFASLEALGHRTWQLGTQWGRLATWNSTDVSFGGDAARPLASVLVGTPRFKSGRSSPTPSRTLSSASLLTEYLRHGDAILEYMEGPFGLAILDASRRHCLLATDRFGIEQVFYSVRQDGSLIIASDLSLVHLLYHGEPELNPQALYDYAYFHMVPSPLTIYAGVHKLPPSHKYVHSSQAGQASRYWLPSFDLADIRNPKQLQQEVIHALRNSIPGQPNSETVGAFLSGGLDSSTLCGILSDLPGKPKAAISIGFDIDEYDEIRFARIAAQHFGLQHHIHYVTPDEIAEAISAIVTAYSEPFGNSSVVPAFLCALAAREAGVDIMLAGDGGDELFAGNERYTKQLLFQAYQSIPSPLRGHILEPLLQGKSRASRFDPMRKIRRYVEQAKVPLPLRLQTFNLLEMQPVDTIFNEDFLATLDVSHPRSLLQAEYDTLDSDALNRMLFCDWRFTLADNDIRKVKRTCELAGVQVVFPFLGEDVVDLACRIPSSLKLKNLRLRYFYKKAMDGYLPKEVIEKKKHGFGLPFGEWLRTNRKLQDMVYDSLHDLGKRKVFRQDFISNLVDNHRQGHAAFYGNMVWVLSMLQWWLDVDRTKTAFASDNPPP